MNKQPVKLDLVSVAQILNENLEIPEYQRIYTWGEKEIRYLWETIKDAEPDFETHIGSLIIYDNGNDQEIVDGQQRLITLSLMLVALAQQKYGKIQESGIPQLLKRPVRNNDEAINIANARWIIENILSAGVDREDIENKILKLRFTKILIPQDDPDLAYIFFNNQNSKGEKLTDFDLLKAHHLRFIGRENEAERLAGDWNRIYSAAEENTAGETLLHQSLGVLVYRLRQLMRKIGFNETGHYIRDEYKSACLPAGMEPDSNGIVFDSPIQGGAHFFGFAKNFYKQYKKFAETTEAKKLGELAGRHRHLYAICECFLFAYFLKFGKSYLTEALFCICAIIGQYRYGRPRITWDIAQKAAFDSNLIYFITHAPSPAFFIGEALSAMDKISPMLDIKKIYTPQLIKNPPENAQIPPVIRNFYDVVRKICHELKENFTVSDIIEKIKIDYTNEPVGKK